MPRPDDEARLRHMLENASEAVVFVEIRDRGALDADRLLSLALVRLLGIVGEAASRVSADTRRSHPEIPWPGIIGLRKRLVHGPRCCGPGLTLADPPPPPPTADREAPSYAAACTDW